MKYNYTVFSTKSNRYLFDGVSGNIFSIVEGIYNNHEHLFKNICNGTVDPNDVCKDDYDKIFAAIANGRLMENSNANIDEYWFDIETFKNDLDNKINTLTIELTDKCNLRCKYCIFGGHYADERQHGDTTIGEDSLWKAIDFFLANSDKRETRTVGFYGGEPFIEFEKIKQITNKLKNIDPKIRYSITTNGLLLNGDIAKWVAETENLRLYVTIGGTPQKHDELRVFPDGTPTFDILKRNMLNIKHIDEKAYCSKVCFMFNILDEIQLEEINDLWFSDDMFKGVASLPLVSCINTIDDDGSIREMRMNLRNEHDKDKNPLSLYISLLKANDYNNLIVKYFDKKFRKLHTRPLNNNKRIIRPVCRPFVRKLFIDTLGRLNMCENVQTGERFGNITDNVVLKKDLIEEMLNEYRDYLNNHCKNCWAFNMCSFCFKDLYNSKGKIDAEKFAHRCTMEKKIVKRLLIDYCTILEEDATLLDHLSG